MFDHVIDVVVDVERFFELIKTNILILVIDPVKVLPVAVDEHLVGPAEAVLDAAVGDVHAVDVLLVDSDDQRQRISDLDGFGDSSVDRFADVDPHRGAGHRGRRRQRRRRQGAGIRETLVAGSKHG